MKTSNPIIRCIVCPSVCTSFAYYPDCNPHNPQTPYTPVPEIVNLETEDFFGQFIPKNIRHLRPQDISRFHDRLFVYCPECFQHKLPLNPTSDGYLICSFCNIHWDLLGNRSAESPDYEIQSRLRPDGSLYRRKVKITESYQLDLLDVPF